MRELVGPEAKDAPERVYYVASTSAHKIGAVKNVLESMGPTVERYTVEGVRAASGINEQPVGHEETLQGAFNRLNNMKEQLRTRSAETNIDILKILVSIENGIYRAADRWFDIAYVVIEDNRGNIAISPSAGIEYPSQFVDETRNRGFASTTVASVMAEKLQDASIETDPHKYLTGGRITRQQLLEEAFEAAQHQLGLKAYNQK